VTRRSDQEGTYLSKRSLASRAGSGHPLVAASGQLQLARPQ